MNLEIHKPELVQRVNAHIQTGQFHAADELLEKALDALEGRAAAPPPRIRLNQKIWWSFSHPCGASSLTKRLTRFSAAIAPPPAPLDLT
jgi:Arc/MetJ-type ribon-helix-helix transcriptional regulator